MHANTIGLYREKVLQNHCTDSVFSLKRYPGNVKTALNSVECILWYLELRKYFPRIFFSPATRINPQLSLPSPGQPSSIPTPTLLPLILFSLALDQPRTNGAAAKGSDRSRLQISQSPRGRRKGKRHSLGWKEARGVHWPLGPHGSGHDKDFFLDQTLVRLFWVLFFARSCSVPANPSFSKESC